MKKISARVVGVVGVLGIVLSGIASAQTADPLVGTWRLNVAKSTFKPGPAPKNITVVIEPAGKGLKIAVDGAGPDGAPVKWGYSSQRDGKDTPVTGSPAYDTASVVQNSPTTGTITYKKGGKVVATAKTEVSPDGKMLTVTSDGTNPQGQAVHNVAIYTRQ
jgi:hypothetical protein